MIKKMVLQNQNFPQHLQFTKAIIFDLEGVILMKKTAEQLMQEPVNSPSMVVFNLLETLSLLKACKSAGHKLYVLSNVSLERFERIKQEPEIASVFSFFDDIVISGMTPYRKPDHQLFTYFCQQYNLQPADCIFIDDKPENLHGAQAASIHKTILCSNFDLQHVKQELISYGILSHNDAPEVNIPAGRA